MNEAVTITPFIQWITENGFSIMLALIPVIIVVLFLGWLMYKFPPPIVDLRRQP